MMIKKIGKIFISFGIICILVSLGFFVYNIAQDKVAEEKSDSIVSEIIEQVESESTNQILTHNEMKCLSIDGYDYVGYISIPKLDKNLPVMSDWSYDRLKISPCRYSGWTDTNDLVIAAHNYINHFGRLAKLCDGDRVVFTDMNNNSYFYTVKSVEVLSPESIDEMVSGEWDLTLFTCNYYGDQRITVRLILE